MTKNLDTVPLRKERKRMLRALKERKRTMCSERKRTQCPTLDFPNPHFFSCPPFLMPFFLPTFLSTTFSLFYAIFPISWKSFFRFSTAIFLPPFFRCPFSAHPFFDVFSPFPHFNAIFLPHFFRRNFFFKAMQSWCVRQSFFLILCHF